LERAILLARFDKDLREDARLSNAAERTAIRSGNKLNLLGGSVLRRLTMLSMKLSLSSLLTARTFNIG